MITKLDLFRLVNASLVQSDFTAECTQQLILLREERTKQLRKGRWTRIAAAVTIGLAVAGVGNLLKPAGSSPTIGIWFLWLSAAVPILAVMCEWSSSGKDNEGIDRQLREIEGDERDAQIRILYQLTHADCVRYLLAREALDENPANARLPYVVEHWKAAVDSRIARNARLRMHRKWVNHRADFDKMTESCQRTIA